MCKIIGFKIGYKECLQTHRILHQIPFVPCIEFKKVKIHIDGKWCSDDGNDNGFICGLKFAFISCVPTSKGNDVFDVWKEKN